MEPNFNISIKFAESRKKRRGGVLEDNIGNRKFVTVKVSSGRFWSSETSDTTEFDSVDMEKKCLVEKTSFDYGDGGAFAEKDLEQIPKSSKILTKRVLGKPLGKINFLGDDIDDVLLDKPVVLSPPLKNLVNVSVRKSFTLDISLDNIVGKSAQEKLVVVRKLFSKINGFGGVSISSKFAEIIRATFTSKSSLVQASKKAEEIKILAVVLKKIPVGTLTETVHAALSGFGVVVSIKIQLVDMRDQHRALLYTLPMGTIAYNIWDYIGSVSEKTCAINCYPITYAWARCTVVCFESANFLNAVMKTTPVLRGVNMHWSFLGFSKYAKCGRLGHTSLDCAVGENFSSGKPSCKFFSDIDKSRLATIYAKHLALIA
ncbi:hypothetical protein G9A89_015338 [Geosiphon pyriformis]|nr:hypothetical protein G9A89_015338 [Geosiphon pyriformis]